jgi:hypothetical protein
MPQFPFPTDGSAMGHGNWQRSFSSEFFDRAKYKFSLQIILPIRYIGRHYSCYKYIFKKRKVQMK